MAKSRVNSALSQYKSVSVSSGVESATPHRLVQMLMEGALDKMAAAKGHMLRNELADKGRFISWAISIISGLQSSLDMDAGGELSRNLDDLYDYMVRRLGEAGAKNDPTILDEVSSLLLEVKSAWDVIPTQLDTENRQSAV
ncbi:flagellar export chaperone FliS [Sedimenticola selenatireducens]|uniref:Flagellar secretion chaperone FliS n=1 Tax=Sedimenticola selenatireducens TaxID=191960 RepID=A0A557SD03_9GAMM|nr:flagellar export chaperone FliS [Sedimenticola selenatireducens]TVO75287.1 flagellar export chaperone FliS [Sedimenticola selenatireducens]TVT66860.1 MAG: flagellar export chaperone FliS [Sedimenticola selenatireducens]